MGRFGILQMYAAPPGQDSKNSMEWRYVCYKSFKMSIHGPNVACNELGYSRGKQQDATVQGDWMHWDTVRCNGSEKSLTDCERSSDGYDHLGYCSRSEAVKLTCITGAHSN